MTEGHTVWTEYEIQSGKAPWAKLEGKTADFAYDTEFGMVFGEVENAFKNRARRAEISAICRRHLSHNDGRLTPLAGGRHLFRLEVVSTNGDALRNMQQTFTEEYDAGLLRDAHLSNVTFTLLPISESLSPGIGWSKELWADILLPSLLK